MCSKVETHSNSRPSGEQESLMKTVFRLVSVDHAFLCAKTADLAQSSSKSILLIGFRNSAIGL